MAVRFIEVAHKCQSCEVTSHEEITKFPYGVDEDAVELEATLTVFECGWCRDMFLTSDAETVKELAVCKHLLSLSEARLAREKRENRLTIVLVAAFMAIMLVGETFRG